MQNFVERERACCFKANTGNLFLRLSVLPTRRHNDFPVVVHLAGALLAAGSSGVGGVSTGMADFAAIPDCWHCRWRSIGTAARHYFSACPRAGWPRRSIWAIEKCLFRKKFQKSRQL